jgi:DNA end-binding protein Ku
MASRPVWRGFLRFSLVSVPVTLYSADRSVSETIKLNQLHEACNSRIQYRKTCPQHGEVKSEEIVTGYEFEEGKYVIVDASEIEKIRPPREKGINVASFITDGSIDIRYFTGKNYHLVPDGPIARTPYALLQRATADSGRAALCELVMRTRKNIALVRPLGNILTLSILSYEAELKGMKEFEDDVPRLEVSPAELKLATQLIDQMSVDDPELDQYRTTTRPSSSDWSRRRSPARRSC